ncbi:magnesium transporter [Persicobacter psychrovividus]|uniref:Magnesium transporter MgtE n=1 Tax=Persicobacter psychrovividus TaxID=387638 RepID=A0ABM7VCB9_9BACT|nr:magnesium transporter MgtE [Persicobacter psychrovividus]
MEFATPFEITKEFVLKLEKAAQSHEDRFIIESLRGVEPADISVVLEELDGEDSKYILMLLDHDVAGEILAQLDEDVMLPFVAEFSPKELAPIVQDMQSDDAVDLLLEISNHMRDEVIAHINDKEAQMNILDLLRYDEDTAGGLMAKELIKANYKWDIVRTIEEIRRQAEDVEKIYSVYVVDDFDRLLGRVSLKEMILAKDHTKVGDIFEQEVNTISTDSSQEEVAEIMQRYDLEALPVVNARGRLVGRITIDDVVDVITEAAEDERNLMAGISEDVEEDDTIWKLSRSRLPWLIIGMGGGMLAAKFIASFEDDLAIIPVLAAFIPLITATGGNVGLQSSSLVVQSLANPLAIRESLAVRLLKVFGVALLNGLVLNLIVFGINMAMGQSMALSLVVAIALYTVVMLSSILGTMTPWVLDKMGVNPAMASGPFITIANDLLGLTVYFTVAHLLLL